MKKSLLIQGGRIIDPGQGIDKTGSLLVTEGKITSLEDEITPQPDQDVLNADGLIPSARLIGIDSSPFKDVTAIASGIYLQGDLFLPSGGDDPVKMGDCATSTRLNSLYLKRLVSLVENGEAMFDDFPFINLLSVVEFFRQDHFWAAGLLGPTRCEAEADQWYQQR